MKKSKRITAGLMAVSMCVTAVNFPETFGTLNVSAVSAGEDEILAGYTKQVWELVNEERKKEGLQPLAFSPELNAMADIRAKELIELYDHTRPDGTKWYTVLEENNLSMVLGGENAAKLYNVSGDLPQEVMKVWLNSSGHRANILRDGFLNIGVGVAHVDDTYYCIQIFTGDLIKWDLSGNILTISGSGNMPDYSPENRPWHEERENITEVSFGDNITGIGNWAFSEFKSLTALTIPDRINEIDLYAFYECTALEEITVLNPECEIADNLLTFPFSTVIVGYENSTAQAYAENYNRKFRSLGEIPSLPLGNLNGDSYIDALDATAVLIEYAALSTDSPSTLDYAQNKAADVNNDGQINAVDATLISSYYSEISTGGTLSFEEFLENNI